MEACLAAGLVGGEGFAVDASLIEADANRQRSIPGVEWKKQIDPAASRRAVKEYLATLNDAAFGAATEVQPKFVSPSDPAAQWTGALKGPAFFAHADNYLIDVQCGVIVDVEASRAIRQAEVGAAPGRRFSVLDFVYGAVLAVALWMTIDLDYPGIGIIRVSNLSVVETLAATK